MNKTLELPLLQPMLATNADEPFDSPEFLFELKWDGYRCLAYHDGSVRLASRHNKTLTPRFREIVQDLQGLPGPFIVDGELVVLDSHGKPNFSALQHKTAQSLATYILFDVLYWQSKNLCMLPLVQRQEELRALLGGQDQVGRICCSRAVNDQGREFYQLAGSQGLEGIMAKRKTSLYFPGTRSKDWLKLKHRRQLNAIIVGYLPRSSRGFKSLYLAQHFDGELIYIGNVGTGFSDQDSKILYNGFQQILRDSCPMKEMPSGVLSRVWIEPILVGRIEYLEFTRDRRLRQPSFLGLRSDLSLADCELLGEAQK